MYTHIRIHIYIYIYIYIFTCNYIQGAVIQWTMPPWLCFKCLFTLPVSRVMFQKSVNKCTPNFCTLPR